MVIEVPAGMGPGTINDAFFRFVVDMGAPGPDRGKGGKYLLVHDSYKGEIPDGYFVARSPSYTNWMVLRGFLVDGKPDAAKKSFTEGVKVYPLAQSSPPKTEFINASTMEMNSIHSNDAHFFKEINDVIQKEPVEFIDAETRGILSSIGIQKVNSTG